LEDLLGRARVKVRRKNTVTSGAAVVRSNNGVVDSAPGAGKKTKKRVNFFSILEL